MSSDDLNGSFSAHVRLSERYGERRVVRSLTDGTVALECRRQDRVSAGRTSIKRAQQTQDGSIRVDDDNVLTRSCRTDDRMGHSRRCSCSPSDAAAVHCRTGTSSSVTLRLDLHSCVWIVARRRRTVPALNAPLVCVVRRTRLEPLCLTTGRRVTGQPHNRAGSASLSCSPFSYGRFPVRRTSCPFVRSKKGGSEHGSTLHSHSWMRCWK